MSAGYLTCIRTLYLRYTYYTYLPQVYGATARAARRAAAVKFAEAQAKSAAAQAKVEDARAAAEEARGQAKEEE